MIASRPVEISDFQEIFAHFFQPTARSMFYQEEVDAEYEVTDSDGTVSNAHPKTLSYLHPDAPTAEETKLPSRLARLVCKSTGLTHSRISHKGVFLTTRNTHKGNSNIIYTSSNGSSPATIEYIYSNKVETFLAIKCPRPLQQGVLNPFAQYLDFPAFMCGSWKEDLELIPLGAFQCHAARRSLNAVTQVYVSLSRVRPSSGTAVSHSQRRVGHVISHKSHLDA